MKNLILASLALAAIPGVASAATTRDPLGSPMWEFVSDQILGENAVVRFDPRVKVTFPEIAENQREFPVQIDARGIANVKRIVIIADLNPIQQAIDYTPTDAEPFIATRIKLDQRTPVRGAVQLTDGSWLVSGGWIDAAGGGCSAPPVSRVKGDWAQHLGEARGKLWRDADGARMILAIRHPMDTGFVDNIASYYIDTMTVKAGDRDLGTIKIQAALAEDPVFTLLPHVKAGEDVTYDGRDTNGIEYRGKLVANAALASNGFAKPDADAGSIGGGGR